MSSAHWKPLPAGLPTAARELAEHLRGLLDDRGVSLRQLANDDGVHYSLTSLHRYFSGQALPSSQLLQVLSQRYGGDEERLRTLFERASDEQAQAQQEAEAPAREDHGSAASEGGPEGGPSWAARLPRRRVGLLIAVAFALVIGGIAGTVARGGSDTGSSDGTASEEQTSRELVFNGDFATGRIKPWWEHGDLTAAWQDGELRIDVPGGTEQPWEAMVGYSGLGLREGEHYVLTFTARASTVAPMGVTLLREGAGDEPELETHSWGRSLGPAAQTFTFPFDADLTSDAMQITLRFGGGDESITAFLDDFSLTRASG